MNGLPAAPVKGLEPGEYIVQCASDGKHVYVGRQAPEGDYRIFKVDPETGERALLAVTSEEGPPNFDAAVSADGTTVAYPSVTRRSTLYLLTGILSRSLHLICLLVARRAGVSNRATSGVYWRSACLFGGICG